IWRLIPPGVTTADVGYKRARIDFPGALLLGAALICLSAGLSQEAANTAIATSGSSSNQAPIQNNPWLIGASLILIVTFIALEVYSARRWSTDRSEETTHQTGSRVA